MTNFLGIELAPIKVPLERRLQTLIVLAYTMTFNVFPIGFLLLCVFLLFTRLYWLSIGYFCWIFYDVIVLETSSKGGRRWEWLRNCVIWKWFYAYFPIELVKSQDLDPEKNYIMGYHPHGVMSCGVIGNFGAEGTGFSEKYPGITPHPLTLQANFKLPLIRGYLLWMGVCDVSKKSIEYITTKKGKGNAAIIVVGGAEEALEAQPGNYNLKLKDRKGFIKMAIRTGADLVPIYSFGENDLFQQVDNPQGSNLRAFQSKFKRAFGVSPPLYHGRGIFNYSIGFLPFRKPIKTVVGHPIAVEKCENPEPELINKYHQLYLDGLSKIFNEHKVKFGIKEDITLNFI